MIPVVKVSGIPKNTNHISLANLFSNFGEVDKAVVDVDPVTGRSLGTGSVRFLTQDSANAACAAGSLIKGDVTLVVSSSS